MPINSNAATYKRSPESRGEAAPYDEKFAGLVKLCETAKAAKIGNIIITWPWVIGDTYEEVIESLSRIAAAQLVLHIVDPGDDAHVTDPNLATN